MICRLGCNQCGQSQRARDGPVILPCGHAWCMRCFRGAIWGYCFAIVIPPPMSCCTKIIQPRILNDPKTSNPDTCLQMISEERFASYEINIKATYCPRMSCGKRLEDNLPPRSFRRSNQETATCSTCHHDMCITCNDATHSPDKRCVSSQERDVNVTRMGLLHTFATPSYHPQFGIIWKDKYDYQEGTQKLKYLKGAVMTV